MKCNNCGYENNGSSNICSCCGHLVQNQNQQAYQNANMTNIDNQQIYQNMNMQNNNVNYNNQNGKKMNIVPIIIAIAVICFIIFVVIRFVIPTIIFKNELSEAKKSLIKTSAITYIKTLESTLLTDSLIGNKKTGTINVEEYSGITYGTQTGTAEVDEELNVVSADICIDGYNVIFDGIDYYIKGKC